MKRIIVLPILIIAWLTLSAFSLLPIMKAGTNIDFTTYSTLQGLYSFEDNLNDLSGKSNTLSLSTGTATYNEAYCIKYGSNSFSFDDSTKLSRANASLSVAFPKSSSTTSMTVGCWVRPAQVGVIQQLAAVVDESGSYYTAWTLSILENNTFEFKMGDTSHTTHSITSTTTISSGTEYHVVGTWDGSNLRIYVNGSAEGSPVAHTSMDTPSGNFIVGMWANSTYAYSGYMDELAVFNECLDSTEISSWYSHGINGGR